MRRLTGPMRRWSAPVLLASARARRSRGRWLWPAVGLAVTVTAAGALAAETVIAADQAARATLAGLSPLARSVRVTWQGPVTAGAVGEATAALSHVGSGSPSAVLVLDPVRLDGVIVRLAAIRPLGAWLAGGARAGVQRLRRCEPAGCRMALVGGGRVPGLLGAAGIRIDVVGRARLDSEVPLGFLTAGGGSWPLLVTSDLTGLDRLAGLSGLYRVHSWVATLATRRLHSWNLAAVEARLAGAQASLENKSQQFGLDAPFAGIDAARASARAAPGRLELLGGAAIVIVAMFVLLGAAALRPAQFAELERLELLGATKPQTWLFVTTEAALLSAAGMLSGAALALAAGAVLAGLAGEPLWPVLAHSLVTPVAALVLAGGWLMATAVLTAAAFVRDRLVLDMVAAASAAMLVAGVVVAGSSRSASMAALPVVCCVAGGLIVARAGAALLSRLERFVRRGPVTIRLAVVGLARNAGLPAFAVAFTAVAIALGGFALSYRATLARGAADQAADRVPLDALVAPSANFQTPLQLASLPHWSVLSGGGAVLPVRRTYATYASGYGSVTEPALGVPADGLVLMHGWRASDGSAALAVLARRLRPRGPVRTPGPLLPRSGGPLSLKIHSPDIAVSVFADLRDPAGDVLRLALGTPGARSRILRARLPRGAWELEAIELDESAGLEATNGHQNAENPAATTQEVEPLQVGALVWGSGSRSRSLSLAGWTAVGALSGSGAALRFQASGFPGVLRPVQPIDRRPLPVLVDPQTAAAAGRGGRLSLTVDELPVQARVVGVLRRFPTVPPSDAGFVVADQSELAAALDAQLPGQGRADELWIATRRPHSLAAALRAPKFASLGVTLRSVVAHALRSAPVARAEARVLLAAAALAAALAGLGLLLVVLGPLRDRELEADLHAQGIGPGAVSRELIARVTAASLLGALPGAAIAVVLSVLAVGAAGRSWAGGRAWPPLVAVVPWPELLAWTALVTALPVLAAAVVLATGRRLAAGGPLRTGWRNRFGRIPQAASR